MISGFEQLKEYGADRSCAIALAPGPQGRA
jgi:hypothetical protein